MNSGVKQMNTAVKQMTLSALMCALIMAATLWFKFTIPGTGVMVTLQVFFVLLTGLLLPPNYCFFTLGAYLMLGLMGLPVFSSVCGPAVLATPSFGYLLGFPFAAAGVSACNSLLLRWKWHRYAAASLGVLINYAVALPYIAVLNGAFFHAPLDISTLFNAYCFAFLPLDIVKALLAATLAAKLDKALHPTSKRA